MRTIVATTLLLTACTARAETTPVAGDRSPIVERIPGSTDVFVTFVSREQAAILSPLTDSFEPVPLERVAGTQLWKKRMRVRADLRASYAFVVGDKQVRDPLNPRTIAQGAPWGESILELPDAPPQPWVAKRSGVAAGTLADLTVGGRTAHVYAPAGYASTQTYPLLVCFDGQMYTSPDHIPAPTILDNLIAAKAIPPMMGVFVDSSEQPQRNIELSNNAQFLAYVTDTLLPAVRAKWSATKDPRQTAVCGASTGGLASAYAAFQRPDVFGNVLSQSGAFWPGVTRDDPEREWLTRQYEAAPKKPIRFVQQVGALEHFRSLRGAGPSGLETNRHLHKVLEQKGYEVHYHEVPGAHEPLSWRGGLADGLIELFGVRSP